tara:strand:+ start:4659 stop:5090 length:432 start_codon:yes stop_codon:yes gene_type:complete
MSTRLKLQTKARSRLITDRIYDDQAGGQPSKMLGLDVATVLSIMEILLPILIDCFAPDDGSQAQQYVKNRHDENKSHDDYRGFDKRLVKSTARRAKQAARRSRKGITWGQAYEIAFATLEDVRSGDVNQASLAIAENMDFMLI